MLLFQLKYYVANSSVFNYSSGVPVSLWLYIATLSDIALRNNVSDFNSLPGITSSKVVADVFTKLLYW